jgi:hypothetical protein
MLITLKASIQDKLCFEFADDYIGNLRGTLHVLPIWLNTWNEINTYITKSTLVTSTISTKAVSMLFSRWSYKAGYYPKSYT